MLEDRSLVCRDCQGEFLFTVGEQQFYREKGLINVPRRCPNCRVLMRVKSSGGSVLTTAEVSCARCETLTRVPFQPNGHKPVYCSLCFKTQDLALEVKSGG
ncbi:MAG: zinc-ribbon domain containing protein [Cyanobacteria bacterium REEB67]|nr:zinc-ribbon domain containing protein [Cyanobacteria bacterium REEB67]